MLRKLFNRKPRLDAENSADRIAALAALEDADQETFARVFEEDSSREVRLRALARLTRPDVLVKALDDTELGGEALSRLLAVIDDDTPDSIRHHPTVLQAALSGAEEPGEAVRAAAAMADKGAMAEALGKNARADVRLAVVEATWEPPSLTELERASRGRDKSVHRVARGRLATLRTASSRRQEENTQTEQMLEAALALADDDPHYDARRDAIERDWKDHLAAVEATDDELSRFSVVARDVNAIRARFPARRQPPKVPDAAVRTDFEALLTEAEGLLQAAVESITAGLEAGTRDDLRRAEEELAAKWNAGADIKPPERESSARFREILATVTTRIDDIERALSLAPEARDILGHTVPDAEGQSADAADVGRRVHGEWRDVDALIDRYAWPEDLPQPAELLALTQRKHELEASEERSEAHVEAMVAEATELLTELRQKIEDGAVQEAIDHDRRLHDLIKRLPRSKAQTLSAELAELGSRVRELREWRTYAQAPKREALCQQLEEMAERPLDPHEQMRVVKSLRAQWNEFGAVDTRRDWELQRRFDRAAERAFEPCRLYFKEQAERREFNLEQRQAIVGVLEDYVADNDWEHADWRGVETVLRQARAEWRQYHPVDRKSGREVTARFEQLADELHGRLKEEWDRNIALKEEIVAEAMQVRESGDRVTDQAESLKALQRRWKSVGPLPRRADQRLWKQFREQCDAVFEARTTVRDRHVVRQQTMADAASLITELERRMEIDPSLNRNMVADYERRLHELGTIPKELARRADEILRDADRIAVQRQSRDEESAS